MDWVTANGATKGSRMLSRGHYFDIGNPLASQPMKVECDQPCLVMLYNTGKYIHEYRGSLSHYINYNTFKTTTNTRQT